MSIQRIERWVYKCDRCGAKEEVEQGVGPAIASPENWAELSVLTNDAADINLCHDCFFLYTDYFMQGETVLAEVRND